MRKMDEDLKKKVMDLLSFMCSSARGCVEEPLLYSPLRIIDSVRRIIDILETVGIKDEFLEREKRKIEERTNLVMYDEQGFVGLLDELVLDFVKREKEGKK
jgi:hypothetical protein